MRTMTLPDQAAEAVSRAQVPLRMSVEAISFSAHADFDQTSAFVEALDPPHVVLVHGEAGEMGRLRALEQQAAAKDAPRALYTPKVAQPVHITHRAQRTAKASICLKWPRSFRTALLDLQVLLYHTFFAARFSARAPCMRNCYGHCYH